MRRWGRQMVGRKSRNARLIDKHPCCCFCGGTVEATTVEHAPPKIFFIGKHRPSGLEFPACSRCNNGTADSDQVAALFAIIMATVHRPEIESQNSGYIGKLVSGVVNNHPEIITALASDDGFETIKVNGEIQNLPKVKVPDFLYEEFLNPWAAKQGFALWYEHKNASLGPEAKVYVHWETNFSLLDNDILEKFSEGLSGFGELRQGKWETTDQYWYKYGFAEKDGQELGAFLLVLQDASAVMIFVTNGPEQISESVSKMTTFQTNSAQGIHEIK